jgi:hypothetical protein
MDRTSRQERDNSPVHAARQDSATARARHSPAGSARHSVTVLAVVALAGEAALGLVGGLPALGLGATVLGGAALLTARYVAGAASQDHGYRRGVRLMTSRAPALGEWYWTVRYGLDPNGYRHSLRPHLQRLYAAKLSARFGVSLHTEPARAAALVGPVAWPWIDPAQEPPSDTVPPETLVHLVDRLESL